MQHQPLVENVGLSAVRAFAAQNNCEARRLDDGSWEFRRDGNIFTATNPVEAISPDIVVTEFAEADEISLLVPLGGNASPGDATVAYLQVTDHGQSRVGGEEAEDIPEVGINVEIFPTPVVPFRNHYKMTDELINASSVAQGRGFPIDVIGQKTRAAAAANGRAVTEYGLLGNVSLDVAGFYNDPLVPETPFTTGAWATATAQQIYDDICLAGRIQLDNTQNRWPANTLLLGTQAFRIVQCARRVDSAGKTVMQEIIEALSIGLGDKGPFVILASQRLQNAAGGAGDNAIFYQRDREVLYNEIPVIHREKAPQESGFTSKIFTEARASTTIITRPAVVLRATGINV